MSLPELAIIPVLPYFLKGENHLGWSSQWQTWNDSRTEWLRLEKPSKIESNPFPPQTTFPSVPSTGISNPSRSGDSYRIPPVSTSWNLTHPRSQTSSLSPSNRIRREKLHLLGYSTQISKKTFVTLPAGSTSEQGQRLSNHGKHSHFQDIKCHSGRGLVIYKRVPPVLKGKLLPRSRSCSDLPQVQFK